jgi:hypothetical protein
VVRIDTPGEADYYRNGGIMQYVLRTWLPRGRPPDRGCVARASPRPGTLAGVTHF